MSDREPPAQAEFMLRLYGNRPTAKMHAHCMVTQAEHDAKCAARPGPGRPLAQVLERLGYWQQVEALLQ